MPEMMLDTNAFNRALDSGVNPATLSRNHRLFVTHIQLNELQATRKTERLNQLIAVFTLVEQEPVPTAAAVWGESEWGGAEFGDAGGAYPAMLERLNALNGNKANNHRDILIGVTALKRRYTLVTNDGDLSRVMREFGGNVMTFEEFTGEDS